MKNIEKQKYFQLANNATFYEQSLFFFRKAFSGEFGYIFLKILKLKKNNGIWYYKKEPLSKYGLQKINFINENGDIEFHFYLGAKTQFYIYMNKNDILSNQKILIDLIDDPFSLSKLSLIEQAGFEIKIPFIKIKEIYNQYYKKSQIN